MMSEVKVDGKWWWIDSMKGIAPVGDDDQPLSAWELFNDTLLFERQPQYVIDDCRPPSIIFGVDERDPRNIAYCLARNRDCYFHPREAAAVGNYYVWEHDKYTYPWQAGHHDPEAYRQAVMEENRNRKAAGWPDHYFCADLFDEEIKTR